MTLVLLAAIVGLLALLLAVIVSTGQRTNRRRLRQLQEEVERLNRNLQTPEERAAAARRLDAIEAEKRRIHGRFDTGGC